MLMIPNDKYEHFYIKCRGHIVTVNVDDVPGAKNLNINSQIVLGKDVHIVRGVEQFRNGFGNLGKSMGILVEKIKSTEDIIKELEEEITELCLNYKHTVDLIESNALHQKMNDIKQQIIKLRLSC